MPIIRSGYSDRRAERQRSYDAYHRKLRKALAPIVALGRTYCARCEELITPDQAWDLGHSDDRSRHTGPEHASCNRGRLVGRLGAGV